MKTFKETARCIRGTWYVMVVMERENIPGKFADLAYGNDIKAIGNDWKEWMAKIERHGEETWGWAQPGDYYTGPMLGILRLNGPLEPERNDWGEVSL